MRNGTLEPEGSFQYEALMICISNTIRTIPGLDLSAIVFITQYFFYHKNIVYVLKMQYYKISQASHVVPKHISGNKN